MTPLEIQRAKIRFSGYDLSATLVKLDGSEPAYLIVRPNVSLQDLILLEGQLPGPSIDPVKITR